MGVNVRYHSYSSTSIGVMTQGKSQIGITFKSFNVQAFKAKVQGSK